MKLEDDWKAKSSSWESFNQRHRRVLSESLASQISDVFGFRPAAAIWRAAGIALLAKRPEHLNQINPRGFGGVLDFRQFEAWVEV